MNTERGRDPLFSPLKAAWRALVDDLGGVAEMARGGITRVGPALLSRYGLIHDPCFVPADVALECDRASVAAGGEPRMLIAHAEALGFQVVPKAQAEMTADFVKHLGASAEHSGKAIGALGIAIADMVVTPQEAAEMLPLWEEKHRRDACVIEDLKRVAGSGNVTPIRRTA